MPSRSPNSAKGISIHVPRERDDLLEARERLLQKISIHVPRERDDVRRAIFDVGADCISIHVPRERDDCETNEF